MFSKICRTCIATLPLLFAVACAGGHRYVSVSIQGEFEKRTITATGLSSAENSPARYCWVEGFNPETNNVYFSGYLNSSGRGIGEVPQNAKIRVRLVARYEVPGSNNYGDFQIRGSVKKGSISSSYNSANAFNDIPDWSVLSDIYTAGNRDINIRVRALDSTPEREAGAFNIASQAVDFATLMALLEPGLGLPNLHSFWSPGQYAYTDYPQAVFDRSNRILTQASNRTIFQHRVMGMGNSLTNGRSDEFNDSALTESFAHMLFADNSYPPVNPYESIVRRDSEEIAWVERHIASETTTAFVSGFCDFISAAINDSPVMLEISGSNINPYHLNAPTPFNKPNGGEFHRQSVAAALYRIWRIVLGGNLYGLQTMWDATYQTGMAKNINNTSYPYGYLQCPIGNISSYLSGLANGSDYGITNTVWHSINNVLDSESISNPNANFFNQEKLWKRITSSTAIETGVIRTYPDSEGIFWDADQAASYHFIQTRGGPVRVTLEMTGGQDLFLELFDSQGILEQRTLYNNNLANREINRTLERGEYVVRVRAGYTTADRLADFRLTIQ